VNEESLKYYTPGVRLVEIDYSQVVTNSGMTVGAVFNGK